MIINILRGITSLFFSILLLLSNNVNVSINIFYNTFLSKFSLFLHVIYLHFAKTVLIFFCWRQPPKNLERYQHFLLFPDGTPRTGGKNVRQFFKAFSTSYHSTHIERILTLTYKAKSEEPPSSDFLLAYARQFFLRATPLFFSMLLLLSNNVNVSINIFCYIFIKIFIIFTCNIFTFYKNYVNILVLA